MLITYSNMSAPVATQDAAKVLSTQHTVCDLFGHAVAPQKQAAFHVVSLFLRFNPQKRLSESKAKG